VTELLLGCGFSRTKRLGLPREPLEWRDLVTCDINDKCAPDLIMDLDGCAMYGMVGKQWITCGPATEKGQRFLEYPAGELYWATLRENSFDEVHAYEVLEHLGQQGDASSFFSTFENVHRILRPGGHLFATVPSRYSAWLWGDPSHRRVICAESLAFLSQDVIAKNREQKTAMSDFSGLWDRDFKLISMQDNHTTFMFCLQAIK
jgi:SAM-dependent methyltransferase